MTDRVPADRRPSPGGLHVQISKLLVAAIIAATAATGALVAAILLDLPPSAPPPPGPNGMPPPPPNLLPLAVFPIVTGFFVLAWLAVLVIFSRDQILLQLRQQHEPAVAPTGEQFGVLLATLRAELAADRERELREFAEHLAEQTVEYGEQRETDGYLHGMRMAAKADPPEANVRSFRRTPPQR
jgi:hypothetical protein